MWLLASNASWGTLAAGVLLMIFFLVKRSRGYIRRTRRGSHDKHPPLVEPDRDTILLDAPPEILRWQVGMHDTARELKAELDSKISVLMATMRLAREESERLEAAIQRAEQLGISSCRDTLSEIERIAEESDLTTGRLPTIVESSLEQHHARILALADAGCGAQAIADRLGIPRGDVELMLSVRR